VPQLHWPSWQSGSSGKPDIAHTATQEALLVGGVAGLAARTAVSGLDRDVDFTAVRQVVVAVTESCLALADAVTTGRRVGAGIATGAAVRGVDRRIDTGIVAAQLRADAVGGAARRGVGWNRVGADRAVHTGVVAALLPRGAVGVRLTSRQTEVVELARREQRGDRQQQ